ncbi:MAG: methyltransferase family protein [Acidimicrobiales bacterium]
MGGFSAFVVALMVEMYGFPLTIYLLSGWLGSRFGVLTLTHEGGHLWSDLIGWEGDPHLSPFQYAGFLLIMVGFLLQWPTIPTFIMFPILVYLYRRLAIDEEREVAAAFGTAWDEYAEGRPRFVPRLHPRQARPPGPTAGRSESPFGSRERH